MVRHPLEACATKFCCCCCHLDPNLTCCVIAFLCITVNAFSGLTNFGILHWALYLMSIFTFLLHLVAGVLLFLGGFWGNYRLKLAYCWIVFFGIFVVIVGFILMVVLHNHLYIIWGRKCHNFNDMVGILLIAIQAVWLVIFDFYSTLIVLGNIYYREECCAQGPSRFCA